MELETYLSGIKNCPDELVECVLSHTSPILLLTADQTADYGVYDNYPILLGGTLEKLADGMHEMGYIFKNESGSHFGKQLKFHNKSESIVLDIYAELPPRIDHNDINLIELITPYFKKRNLELNVFVKLHPAKIFSDWLRNLKDMVPVITDISQFAIEQKLPLCLPTSPGRNHSEDYSRIVYYFP